MSAPFTAFLASLLGITLLAMPLSARAAEKVAYVKDSEVFVGDDVAQEGRQLTNNGVPKWLVRWSPDGQLLAYVEMTDPSVAKGRLIVLDPSGEVLMNALIHEVKGTRIAGFRWIDELTWFTDDSIGVHGSYNPTHCELIILKPSSGEVLHDIASDCGSYWVSPDGQHVAYLQTVETGVNNGRQDYVLLDREIRLYPPPQASPVSVSGMPRWSEDSSRIAFVAKTNSGESVDVIVADKTGMVSEQEVAAVFGANAELAWSGDSIVLRGDNLAIVVDPVARNWRAASSEEEAVVAGMAQGREDKKRKARAQLEAKHGWRSVDVWSSTSVPQ